MKKFAIPFLVLIIAAFLACGDDGGTNGGNGDPVVPRLVVDLLAQPSATDVNVGWADVDSVEVEIGGSLTYGVNPNIGNQNVMLKAVVRDDMLYIRAKWHDATANVWGGYLRNTNDDGNGNFELNIYEGEDMFFVLFGEQNNDPELADCASMCHVTEHHTTDGGNADVWKWMSTRTAPGFLAEDEYWGAMGREIDTRDVVHINTHLYRTNWHEAWHQPNWMHITGSAYTEPYLYLADTADEYMPLGWEYNARISGYGIDGSIYDSPNRTSSSRWDVAAISEFDSTGMSTDWTWTVVFSRALGTGHDDDINLIGPDSVQISIAATHNDTEASTPAHSGSEPFWLILNP